LKPSSAKVFVKIKNSKKGHGGKGLGKPEGRGPARGNVKLFARKAKKRA